MNVQDKKEIKVKFPLRKSIIWSGRIMITVVLLLTAIQLILNVYSNEILGSVLRKYVKIKSDNLYTLNFKECNLNFFGGEVTFNEIYLLPDPFEFNKIQKGRNPKSGILEVYFPYAKVNGSSLKAIIGFGSWEVEYLEISQPYIKYISYHPRSLIKKSKNWIGSIINLGMNNQVKLLQIENGIIQDGKFHLVFHKQDTIQEVILNNIKLELTNLVADSLNSGSFYHALAIDDLIFSIDNNKIDLPASPYSINIDDMTYSSTEQNLNISGLELKKKVNEPVTKKSFSIEYIRLPELTLKSIDLEKLVANREVIIDEMILKNPENHLVIQPQHHGKKQDDPFKTFFKTINKVQINKINVENAHFDLDQKSGNALLNSLNFNNISLSLNNLLIDTINYNNRKPRFFLDDFMLHAGNQVINLPQSNDVVSLATIDISTKDKSILISDLHFSTETSLNKFEIIGDISTSDVAIENLDIWKAIVKNELDVEKLSLNNVMADIKISEVIQEIDTIETVDESITDNIPTVDLDLLVLNRARINLNYQLGSNTHYLNIRDLNTKIFNIHLDQSTLDDSLKTPIYDHFDLAINSAKYLQNDTSLYIACESITGKDNLNILDLNTFHYEDRNGLNFDFKTAGLAGLSLSDLSDNNHLVIDDLVVDQPAFLYNAKSGMAMQVQNNEFITRLPFTIDILNSSIENGYLEFHASQEKYTSGTIDNFSVCMKEFHVDSIPVDESSSQFSIHDLQIDGTGIQIQVLDSTHKLDISDFMVSLLDSLISINDISLKPMVSTSNLVDGHVNSVHINSIDIFNSVFSNELTIPELILDNPDIRITKQASQKQGNLKHNISNSEKATLPFNSIWLQSINLKHGNIVFQDKSENRDQYFLLDKVDLLVHDLIMDRTLILNPEKLLLTANLQLISDQLIYQTPDENYTLKIEDINISSFDSLITGSSFHLIPRNYGDQKTTYEVNSPQFAVTGLDLYNLVDSRTFNAGELLLQSPKVHYVEKNTISPEQISLNEIKFNPENIFQEVNIDRIDIPNGQLIINNTNADKFDSHIIENVTIDVSDIHLNRDNDYSSPFEYAENFEFVIHGMDVPLKSPYYSLNVDDVEFSSSSKSLSIRNIVLTPFAEKTEFCKHFEYQVSWINLEKSSLDISGINLEQALNGYLIANKISISNSNLDIYKDKNFPFDENKAPLLPISALKQVPFKVIIDSIAIENSNIDYSEFAEHGHNPGSITFKELEALILNVTNDSIAILDNRSCITSIKAMLMGTGEVNLNILFDLSSDKDYHSISGTLNQMDLEEMNDFMENVAFARITGGKNNAMSFNMDFDDRITTGIMKFNYDDLKVTFIDKKSSKTGMDEAMGAFVANTFILKKDNPRYLLLRNGNIYYYRDSKKSIFSYWARSFLSGIKSSIGLKVNKKKIDRKALSRAPKKN